MTRCCARLLAGAAILAGLLASGCGGVSAGEPLNDAQQVIADLKLGPSDLAIIGGVDRAGHTYGRNEPIGLTVEVNQAAYVSILRVLPNGATSIVFPNREHPSAKVAADTPVHVPDQGSSLKITGGATGTVLFEFIAAGNGTAWLFNRRPEGSAEFAELGTTTRALAKDILSSLKPGPASPTAAAHQAVRVEGD